MASGSSTRQCENFASLPTQSHTGLVSRKKLRASNMCPARLGEAENGSAQGSFKYVYEPRVFYTRSEDMHTKTHFRMHENGRRSPVAAKKTNQSLQTQRRRRRSLENMNIPFAYQNFLISVILSVPSVKPKRLSRSFVSLKINSTL